MKKILCIITVTLCMIFMLSGCSSEYDKYIEEVKTGYLGGCLDVTVDEVFSQSMPNGKWDGGETDDGKIIVEYQGELSGSEVRIQFTVENENIFKLSAIQGDNVQPQNAAEAAAIIESRYVQYYSYKYPSKAAADLMPNEPTENLLNGISSAYAEKAKNPVDIANYLDKTQNEIQTAFNLKDDGAGTYSSSEISLMYGDSKVDNVTIKGSGIYSLFGVQTYQSIDTVSGKIGDRFEKISEEEKQDGTKSVAFIRNNSEDSLIVTYSPATSCVTELTYISNGMAGYRAEQERLKKEAEEKAAAEAAAKAKAEAEAAKQVNSAQKAINKIKESRRRTGEAADDDFMGNVYSAEEYSQYYLVDVRATRNVDGSTRYKVYKSTGDIEYLGAGSEW